jgi:hypothetical protein
LGPVAGASVVIKGTTNGTMTDMDGNFTLDGVKNGDIIQISFIGYATQEIPYAGQASLSVHLEEDTQKLDEVVVTALGMKRDKKALGYAMQELKGDELLSAREPNLANSLSGKVSGLQIVRSSNGVGGSSKIVLRGNSSLTGSNQPLIVVDGTPMDFRTGKTLGRDLDTGFYQTTMAGGKCTQAALALAELCYNTLLEEGEKAMLAAEQHVVTPALEHVIEANTYLSGVGFESGGLAVHNGLTAIPDAHHYYHGEKVAFGTLTQLVLENAPVEEIETVAALSHAVGLPITLAQLDIKEDVPAKMRIVAEAACAEGETIHNMPGGATPDQVYAALLVADQYGQRFLQEWE